MLGDLSHKNTGIETMTTNRALSEKEEFYELFAHLFHPLLNCCLPHSSFAYSFSVALPLTFLLISSLLDAIQYELAP